MTFLLNFMIIIIIISSSSSSIDTIPAPINAKTTTNSKHITAEFKFSDIVALSASTVSCTHMIYCESTSTFPAAIIGSKIRSWFYSFPWVRLGRVGSSRIDPLQNVVQRDSQSALNSSAVLRRLWSLRNLLQYDVVIVVNTSPFPSLMSAEQSPSTHR